MDTSYDGRTFYSVIVLTRHEKVGCAGREQERFRISIIRSIAGHLKGCRGSAAGTVKN
jgi:hypothetical protein